MYRIDGCRNRRSYFRRRRSAAAGLVRAAASVLHSVAGFRMFSRRVPADHSTNRLSAAIEEQRARGAPFLDLTESNPTRCGFHHDRTALLEALASPGALLYEPHPQG